MWLGRPTTADVSKIHQDMNALQVRVNKITSADFRSKSSKPWKPEVTPPRRRGGFNRGRGGRQFDNVQRNDRFKNSENNGSPNGDNDQRNNNGNFRSRGQGRGNFRGNIGVKVGEEVDLTRALILEGQEEPAICQRDFMTLILYCMICQNL